MASNPRVTIDDSYILGITCAICGADALGVNHVSNLPDFVNCSECQSAFLVEEGGDRVFYGQIAAGYDETERFALKQWAWIEAVETRAREERPRPPGEDVTMPDPETIEESVSEAPEVEPLSAEEWISSEIPTDLVDEALAGAQDVVADVSEPVSMDMDIAAEEEPTPYSPFEAEEEPAPIPELAPEGDEGLADFFEALTDDTGEVAPIADPDEFIGGEEPEDPGAFDADMERLLQTEDDTGPELPPPPWAAEDAEAAPPVEPEAPAEDLPAWEDISDEFDAVETDAVPVVDAKDETYESMPGWQRLEEGTPLDQEEPESETPDWASVAEEDDADLSESWAELDSLRDSALEQSEPETPDWALPADEEAETPTDQFTGPDKLSWGTEPVEESAPGWQQIPGMFSEEADSDEDEFIADLRRSAAVPLESQPVDDQPLGTPEQTEEPAWDMGADDLAARMDSISQPADYEEPVTGGWARTAAAASVSSTPAVMPDAPQAPDKKADPVEEIYTPPPGDPPPGQRSRVVIRGERVIFPAGECAHCGRTPAKGKLAVAGSLPRGQAVGQRKPTRFEVPLCANCRKRAAAKSEEASAAQLQAHLISAIVGMIFVVGALALDLINPRDLSIVDLFLGLILLIVGYGGPAYFLLNRVGNFLPPVDARYVRTTLLVPSETQDLVTAFEWRNSEFATRFHGANSANAIGDVTGVKERLA